MRERAEAAAKQSQKRRSSDFDVGYAQAYFEVVSHMQNQAEVFDIPLADLCLDDFDPYSLLRR
jgi:hypothetical protein